MASLIDYKEKHANEIEAAEIAKPIVDKFLGKLDKEPTTKDKIELIDGMIEGLEARDGPVAHAVKLEVMNIKQSFVQRERDRDAARNNTQTQR